MGARHRVDDDIAINIVCPELRIEILFPGITLRRFEEEHITAIASRCRGGQQQRRIAKLSKDTLENDWLYVRERVFHHLQLTPQPLNREERLVIRHGTHQRFEQYLQPLFIAHYRLKITLPERIAIQQHQRADLMPLFL